VLISNTTVLNLLDVAADGRLLVVQVLDRSGLLCQRRGESRERELAWLDGSVVRDLASDGSAIVFSEFFQGRLPKGGVFLRKTDGSPAVRLGDGWGWGLSSDGRWALTLTPGQPTEIVLLPTGPGAAKRIPPLVPSKRQGDSVRRDHQR
jgi:hypothetical protein